MMSMATDAQTTTRTDAIRPSAIHRLALTPTRNESWIIERFLGAAKMWADYVVVADQGSTDGTFEIAQQASRVLALVNNFPAYDELQRQRLLLQHARTFAGRRVLIALDADEALSANSLYSHDWDRIAAAVPGTVLRFRWVNILPGFKQAWIPPEPRAFGLIDDGALHSGSRIHSPRLPFRSDAPVLDLEDIVVLHFQYVIWARMESKQRWYQAWEHTKHQRSGSLDIYRQYHHMHGGWDRKEIHALRPEWLEGYDRYGIDFRTVACEQLTWWDKEVAAMLREHGTHYFRRIAIWDTDWTAVARHMGFNDVDFSDPRTCLERTAHALLALTQNRRGNLAVRAFERLLRSRGW
jgi:hypothetical protein